MGTPRFNAPSLQHKEDHLLLPEEILIEEKNNGRFEPHTPEKIRERAIDMIVNGQLQPVGIKKALDLDKKPKLVFGYLRTLAGQYINREIVPKGGIEVDGEFIKFDTQFKLWASQVEGDDRESLIKNIVENLSREGTTVMDMVTNQDRLLKAGMSEDEVAKLYRTPVALVRRNRQLLSLPRETQAMIHHGVLASEAGFLLLTVSEEKQKEIIAQAAKEAEEGGLTYERSEQEFRTHIPSAPNHPRFKPAKVETPIGEEGTTTGVVVTEVTAGATEVTAGATEVTAGATEVTAVDPAAPAPKLSTAAVRRGVRAARPEGKKGPALTFSEFKDFISDFNVVGEDDVVREWAEKTLKFIKGDLTDKQYENAVYKMRDDRTARSKSKPAKEVPEKKE